MDKIASFTINHNILQKGMYVSRIDGDIITYDIRTKKPNGGDYMSNGAMHTIEHLFATFVRNSSFGKEVIYVGPMGCRTGFYLLMRKNVSVCDAISLVREMFQFIINFEGEIPGSLPIECGNYLEHDISGAKDIARDMANVLKNYKESDTVYIQ